MASRCRLPRITRSTSRFLAAAALLAECLSGQDATSWRGRNLTSTAPLDQQAYSWSTANRRWEPKNFVMQTGAGIACNSASGSGTAYTCTPSPAFSAYSTGMFLTWKPDITNTGSATLAVNGLAAKTIQKVSAGALANLASGDVVASVEYLLIYNGTVMVLAGAGGGASGVASASAGTGGGVLVNCSGGAGTGNCTFDGDTAFFWALGNNVAPSGNVTPSAGAWDLTSASSVTLKKGSADPGTCSEGQLFFNTTSHALKQCTATNTWSAIGGSTSSVTSVSGVSSGIDCTAATDTLLYTIPNSALTVTNAIEIWATVGVTSGSTPVQTWILFGSTRVSPSTLSTTGDGSTQMTHINLLGANLQRYNARITRDSDGGTAFENANTTVTTSGTVDVKLHNESSCGSGKTMTIGWDIRVIKNGSGL